MKALYIHWAVAVSVHALLFIAGAFFLWDFSNHRNSFFVTSRGSSTFLLTLLLSACLYTAPVLGLVYTLLPDEDFSCISIVIWCQFWIAVASAIIVRQVIGPIRKLCYLTKIQTQLPFADSALPPNALRTIKMIRQHLSDGGVAWITAVMFIINFSFLFLDPVNWGPMHNMDVSAEECRLRSLTYPLLIGFIVYPFVAFLYRQSQLEDTFRTYQKLKGLLVAFVCITLVTVVALLLGGRGGFDSKHSLIWLSWCILPLSLATLMNDVIIPTKISEGMKLDAVDSKAQHNLSSPDFSLVFAYTPVLRLFVRHCWKEW
eukprot:jgi/Bigna1/75570/fgenesh1_pg.35_\